MSRAATSLGSMCAATCNWKAPWDAWACFDRLSVWFPELARQVLIFMLETLAGRTITSSSLFFIPCPVPAFWWGLSRHLIELPTVHPHLTPLQHPPMLPIPIIVLCLPPHQRSHSTKDRLACSATPTPMPFGTGNKRHCCMGCRLSLLSDPCVVWCLFSDDGFPFWMACQPAPVIWRATWVVSWSVLHLSHNKRMWMGSHFHKSRHGLTLFVRLAPSALWWTTS
jgi:hypothetical protein